MLGFLCRQRAAENDRYSQIRDNSTGETRQRFDTGSVNLASGTSVNYAPFTIHNAVSIFGLPAGTGIQGLFGVVKVSANVASYLGAVSTFTMSGSTQSLVSYAD